MLNPSLLQIVRNRLLSTPEEMECDATLGSLVASIGLEALHSSKTNCNRCRMFAVGE